ncbi:MAG TPA: DNA-formamidopyrimidine glycosylase family protein [Thermoanaerobaculaceae bacterium]|nr:DNA-formamidopyrimidine glycosylase family protein [Thermoanaerobaculaceae bacterium]
MPELPDVALYVERLTALTGGQTLERVRLASPFLLRTVTPGLSEAEGKHVARVRRLGKRIVISVEGDLHLIIHLMIAGRLHWRTAQAALPKKVGLAAFDFSSGTLLLTEAGSKRRASLHVVRGEAALAEFDRGGVEVLEVSLESFRAALRRENHTLKRALTDPTLLSGIGNAYSDEILHRARLSPAALTGKLTEREVEALFDAARATLSEWVERLRGETGDGFPEKVTAFRDGMAVHGRYGKPCPACGSPVQRIVYAANEANYCARCQTGGKLLADRALSRLLKGDWPRTLEELEERLSSQLGSPEKS